MKMIEKSNLLYKLSRLVLVAVGLISVVTGTFALNNPSFDVTYINNHLGQTIYLNPVANACNECNNNLMGWAPIILANQIGWFEQNSAMPGHGIFTYVGTSPINPQCTLMYSTGIKGNVEYPSLTCDKSVQWKASIDTNNPKAVNLYM